MFVKVNPERKNNNKNNNKTNLTWHLYVKSQQQKKNRTRHETYLKFKKQYKYTRTSLSNGVLLSLLLTLDVFF